LAAWSIVGGRCEIRTHEWLAPLPDFKSGALNRSANLPVLIRKGFYPATGISKHNGGYLKRTR
jgi:hypothetical protein